MSVDRRVQSARRERRRLLRTGLRRAERLCHERRDDPLVLRAGGEDEHAGDDAGGKAGEDEEKGALAHATHLSCIERVARALTGTSAWCGANSVPVRSSCVERIPDLPGRVASSERAEAMRDATVARRRRSVRTPSVETEGSA